MKKCISALMAALCLLLTGCGVLLERSYSVVEPYSARFWESGIEDTLKAESYQDLVNSLLLLVEEGSTQGHIRFYTDEEFAVAFSRVLSANNEVRQETVPGSYLLENLTVSAEKGAEYLTLNYDLVYRQDVEDPDSLMLLSDSQSLTDLLRIALREGHAKITARFVNELDGERVVAVVEDLWREMNPVEDAGEEGGDAPQEVPGEEEALPPQQDETEEAEVTEEDEEVDHIPEEEAEETAPADGEDTSGEEPEEPVQEPLPPCPWQIQFYPNRENAQLVEILLLEPVEEN